MRYWVCPRVPSSSVHNETTLQYSLKISSEETKLVSSAKATDLRINSCKNGHFAARLCLSITLLTFANLGGIFAVLLQVFVSWRSKRFIYRYWDLPIKIVGNNWCWLISQSETRIRNFTSEEKSATEPEQWIFTSDTSKDAYMPLVYRRVLFSPENNNCYLQN